MFPKLKKKKNLKTSLLLSDAILIIIIFFSIYILFETVIKKILIIYNIDNFYENTKEASFDLSNSLLYLEEKRELPYKPYINEILNYIKLSSLKRTRFNNSLVAIILPEQENLLIAGRKNKIDFTEKNDFFKYDQFKKLIIKNKEEDKKYIIFNVDGKQYIGVANILEQGIRKNLDRNNNELIYPIFISADRDDEFFYLIYRVRNIFYILLGIVFVFMTLFKIYNTFIITKEIYNIKDNMMQISKQVKEAGIVSSSTDDLSIRFIETNNLNTSFNDLVISLTNVGEIISGIADKDLFSATLKNDNSLLNPHIELMAVLFLDIEGFTSITEKHKENIITIVNHIWTEVERIIEKYNGKVNKLIGDASLILFREKDTENGLSPSTNALFSAVELLEKVPEITKDLDIYFNFRIGLDYGKITYGKTGTDKKYELGVIGDTVNIASRLEALGKQYHINLLLTDNILQNISTEKDNFILNNQNYHPIKIDKARPKGKKEALELYTVLKENEKTYAIIGSDKYYEHKVYKFYNNLLDNFFYSLKYWEEYQRNKKDPQNTNLKNANHSKAIKAWSILVKKFALAYKKLNFPLAHHFIKLILKYEEYEEFNHQPNEWFKKKIYQVKEPTEDWVKLKSVELEK